MTATVTLPNVPKTSKKVSESKAQEVKTVNAEPAGTAESLTYGQAIKLIAGILRHNPDSVEVVDCIRDVVAGTGLDVTYEQEEEEGTQEA